MVHFANSLDTYQAKQSKTVRHSDGGHDYLIVLMLVQVTVFLSYGDVFWVELVLSKGLLRELHSASREPAISLSKVDHSIYCRFGNFRENFIFANSI